MQHESVISYMANRTVRPIRILLVSSLLPLAAVAFGQQSYVGRFDAYAGYMYLDSPHINLGEHGYHLQAGVRAKKWLSLGVDYSNGTGPTSITPDLLLTSLQQQLGAQLAQLVAAKVIPATYTLSVPLDSKTQNFAAGPQVAFRHWSAVTLFVRPSVGFIHESATPHPGDAVATAIVAQLAPEGKKTDWTKFYGFGGGFELNLSKHFAVRVQADLVRDHLFDDLLKDARNTVRFSIGPGVQFGKNVGK